MTASNYLLLLFTSLILAFFKTPDKAKDNHMDVFAGITLDGKELIVKKGCTLCHHPVKKIIGPAFKDIASKYNGNAEKILNFLEGKAQPIVHPEEFQYMKPVLSQMKHATKEERTALAKYIAGIK